MAGQKPHWLKRFYFLFSCWTFQNLCALGTVQESSEKTVNSICYLKLKRRKSFAGKWLTEQIPWRYMREGISHCCFFFLQNQKNESLHIFLEHKTYLAPLSLFIVLVSEAFRSYSKLLNTEGESKTLTSNKNHYNRQLMNNARDIWGQKAKPRIHLVNNAIVKTHLCVGLRKYLQELVILPT